MKKLEKLVDLGTAPLGTATATGQTLVERYGKAGAQLDGLLGLKNGFYAFESALHVLPMQGPPGTQGLLEWNDEELWRQNYDGMADDAVFFAEDVFGMQFCFHDGAVCTFDPETGDFEHMAANLEKWAAKVLSDYELWTGYEVAHAWQQTHGRLPVGTRLIPTIPFVLGGDYSVANVHAVDAVKGMKYRASIALQIRDLPEGATVKLEVID